MYRIRKSYYILSPLLLLLLFSSCKEENYLADEARSMMLYQKNQTGGNLLALAKCKAQTIAAYSKTKERQAGLYADYAVCLANLGLKEEANKWFNLERVTFPTSAAYISGMKAKHVPAYASDTLSLPDSRKPDEGIFASFVFNDADETLEPELPDVSDDFSDDPASIQVQVNHLPEMSDKEVAAMERGKNAQTDEERELSAEERAKAKKQAAKEKEKAKKKAAKEKEKAKKQAAKEKEQAKKQAAKEKEAAKKQAQQEKELAKKQAQEEKELAKKEKEQAKKQAAKEKEQARKQAAKEKEEARKQAAKEKEEAREQVAREREEARERATKEREEARARAAEERAQKRKN